MKEGVNKVYMWTHCERILHKLEQLSGGHWEAGDGTHGKGFQLGLHLLHLVGLDGAKQTKQLPIASQRRTLHPILFHQL